MQIQQRETTLTDQEHQINSSMNINNSYMAPWNSETSWTIANGALESSVTVESFDYPITDSDQQDPTRKSPLVLELPAPDSGPCEIRICFRQKYDISQVYVRSTARVYEIYYANSPQSSNEYLCTVRCGVAERDEMFLQSSGFKDVTKEHEVGFVGELTEELKDEGSIVTSEDDWINIKAPEDGISSSSSKTHINRGKNEFSSTKTTNTDRRKKVQDMYEATAQISDADHCTVLTIRLLSLQDKDCVCIDEIYVYADPVESIDAGNQAMQQGTSNGSSLMTMLIPTLLQLSKSGNSHVYTHASGEVQKNDKMETGSPTIDATEIANRKNHIKELEVNQQFERLQKGDESASEPANFQPSSPALNTEARVEPVDLHDLPQGRLERALEQLISRVSKVEDVCLRFEEKILKPIESIEARLQKVEQQLETFAKSSQNSGMPHCGRISAPPFSCSQSNSSSFHNEGSNYQPCEESELEKDFSFSNISNLSHNAPNSLNAPDFHPSLVVSAPEFLCNEDEEYNDVLEQSKDPPCVKPKQTSINSALAAALSGFMSAATTHSSEDIETTSGFTGGVGENNRHLQHAVSLQMNARDSPTVENGCEEFSHYTHIFSVAAPDARDSPTVENGCEEFSYYTHIFSVAAPDFTAKEFDDEEQLNNTQSPSDLAFVIRDDENDYSSKIVPPNVLSENPAATAKSWYFNGNKSLHDLGSTTSSAECAGKSRTNLDNGHLSEISDSSTLDISLKVDTGCSSMDNSIDSPLDQAEELSCQIIGKTKLREASSVFLDDKYVTSEQDSGPEFGNTSDTLPENAECTKYVAVEGCCKDNLTGNCESSRASLVDFDIPILEVKFDFNDYTSITAPLEVLLDGAAESNVEPPFIQDTGDVVLSAEEKYIVMDDSEPTATRTSNHLLVDLGISPMDVPSNMEDGSCNLCGPSNPEMSISLI